MRAHDLNEGPRDDIRTFAADFNDPMINKRVQQQAARKNPAWKKSLIAVMAARGFSLVGAGVNGAVFQHPGYAYVLKVYRTDRGYDEWLYFCRTHSANPHVPQIRGQTMRLNNIFSVVRLEPLSVCDHSIANDFLDPMMSAYSGVYADMVKYTKDNPDLGEIAKFMRDWEVVSDLTAHNVMKRANGDLVIIDPIYIEPGRELDW